MRHNINNSICTVDVLIVHKHGYSPGCALPLPIPFKLEVPFVL